jgi:catechol 2,3-dioxygenase-like lactoylglutathione lyase family enzyme
MNVFYNTIVLVKDLKQSKEFYAKILGLKVESEYETILFFENHFVIHDGNALLDTIYSKKPAFNFRKGNRNIDIYLETDDIEGSYNDIAKSKTRIIHGIKEQAWGQKVFRFYDPDRHIVEIGEAMHLEYLISKPEPLAQ